MPELINMPGSSAWYVNLIHDRNVICDCKARDGSAKRGAPHRYRVTTGTDDKRKAKEILDAYKKSIARDEPQSRDATRLTFRDCAALLRTDYDNRGKCKATLAARLRHLEPAFAYRRVLDLRPSDVARYVADRRKAGAANGTINRELEVLARSLVLARREGLFTTLRVRDHRLRESAPRTGFFERDQYESVLRHLTHTVVRVVDGKRRKVQIPADDLRLACQIMHELGWRKNEVMTLERRHVNITAGTLRLDPGTTKNGEGREAYVTPALRASLAAQLARLDAWQRQTKRVAPWLFVHLEGPFAGQRITDFVRAWRSACKAAGVPGMLRHDFRRTAVRGLVNAGVSEIVAMKITGHKTRSVFDRYSIVAPADLQRAARLLAVAQRENASEASRS
jgi:integrase